MAVFRLPAGRGITRPALVLASFAAAAVVGLAAVRNAGSKAERGPIAVANRDPSQPIDSVIGSVRHIFHSAAPARLLPDTLFPDQSVQLLWLEGRSVSVLAGRGSLVLDGAGGVVRFDNELRPHRARLELGGRAPISVAWSAGGGFWVVDADGTVQRAGADGRIVQEIEVPFDYPAVVSDPRGGGGGGGGGGAWLVRSTAAFSYRLATDRDPLFVSIDTLGGLSGTLGSILLPEHVLLAELANAGHISVGNDAIYYAPFIRDEVVALSRDGDTLWVAHRGLLQSTPDPRFEIGPDGVMIDYAPVNLGAALGADGHLYVLSVPGFTTSESRLDVFDPATGELVRSARLPTPLPTLATDVTGRVYLLDPFRLLTGIAPREREAFAAFDLERVTGGRLTLDDLRGRVVLINFWASWCAPCRTEMPALDSLRRSIEDPEFAFVTMNEDVMVGDAKMFLEEFGFDFPVLLGRGRLQRQYHYIGLPYTVLLDREGRVVQRWIGFAGEEQIAAIRAVIVAELTRGAARVHEGH